MGGNGGSIWICTAEPAVDGRTTGRKGRGGPPGARAAGGLAAEHLLAHRRAEPVAANRACLAAFERLDIVGPGIHSDMLWELMTEEGIVDTHRLSQADWRAMMRAR